MELLIQQIASGFATGAIYACVALSAVMIYQAIHHINFAQGEMAMFSTFIALQLILWGIPYWLAFVMTTVISFAGGLALERIMIRPLLRSSAFLQVVMFIALMTLFNSGAGAIWGHTVRTFPSPFGFKPFLGSSLISNHQAGMLGISLLILLLLFVFFRYSRVGLAMTAAAADPVSARLVGVRVGWMTALGWGLASAIGAVAGMLVAPVVYLEPNMMMGILVYGFAGAVLGGLTSPLGAVVGGILVGIIENMAGTYIPVIGTELRLTIALLVIIAMLLIRPRGLFGRLIVERV
ncbi:branched-chain amino acid ABC transporter permease [Variovorax ureilyticus]|uniref:Branched-chain amino acid ABC transporter permease n=1 Tax=Variovorax ureilyticus TaxID=1836198 RepID=A0ABU8VLX9_9BURK